MSARLSRCPRCGQQRRELTLLDARHLYRQISERLEFGRKVDGQLLEGFGRPGRPPEHVAQMRAVVMWMMREEGVRVDHIAAVLNAIPANVSRTLARTRKQLSGPSRAAWVRLLAMVRGDAQIDSAA
jgi:hypothetical protein